MGKEINIHKKISHHVEDVPQSGKNIPGLKVCGMKYADNIESVAALQPDYMGFIFYEKSARFFDGTIPKLPESIKKTGVFVDASIENVLEKVEKFDLQAVQLHGKETAEFCNTLKSHFERSEKSHKIEIIKVFSIKDDFDFNILKEYEEVTDYFLFDTKGKLPGGNGYVFNWQILQNYPSKKPFFLSGGIGINEMEKIKNILKTNLPIYIIDVNSKFEEAPGLKNIEKLKEFKKNIIADSKKPN